VEVVPICGGQVANTTGHELDRKWQVEEVVASRATQSGLCEGTQARSKFPLSKSFLRRRRENARHRDYQQRAYKAWRTKRRKMAHG
jgi:hypothetical protein